ncbi:hypothetical protein XU18_1200 [Perkinsela sp. CCAP 1560/4]|nr:hypothetical protein XU18_1200 [Perkinsela sp. CCAP 1560/4]|eukprot:KNH08192.1 hypothetical protein XU18_1200 [Perkinsela sp. CCAP 1560/4]
MPIDMIAFCLTADVQSDENWNSPRMHKILVDSLMVDINLGLIRYLSRKGSVTDLCNYRPVGRAGKLCTSEYFSVKCADGELRVFEVSNFREQGNYRYEYLPQSVESLMIKNCDQMYELRVRLLPAKAQLIVLSDNVIYGSIDLTCLPDELEHFDVSGNVISGQITLTRLPLKLVELNMSQNRIKQKVVYCNALPETIRSVNLRGNKIRRIRQLDGIHAEDFERLSAVFHRMEIV